MDSERVDLVKNSQITPAVLTLKCFHVNFDHITKLSGWITMVNELDIQSQGKLKDVRCQWDHPSEDRSVLVLAASLVSPEYRPAANIITTILHKAPTHLPWASGDTKLAAKLQGTGPVL